MVGVLKRLVGALLAPIPRPPAPTPQIPRRGRLFAAKDAYRWILAIDEIDAYLVKSFEPEPFTKSIVQRAHVKLHDVQNQSVLAGLVGWVRFPKKRKIEFKQIDPHGTVIERWTAECEAEAVAASPFDYASNAYVEITLSLVCTPFLVEHIPPVLRAEIDAQG